MPIKIKSYFYVESRTYESKNLNHSFENFHSIVCWDINSVDLKNEKKYVILQINMDIKNSLQKKFE